MTTAEHYITINVQECLDRKSCQSNAAKFNNTVLRYVKNMTKI